MIIIGIEIKFMYVDAAGRVVIQYKEKFGDTVKAAETVCLAAGETLTVERELS